MEGSVRSGGVLKKKTSSGCLIIKKKVDNRISGGGLRGSGVNSNEKKRPRLVANDSGASDEDDSLEFMRRRKVNDKRLHNGSMDYERSELEVREYNRNNFGIDISGERKRSRLNLYDFDEYDEFEGKRMRNQYMEDGFMMGGGNSKEFDVGSSRGKLMLDKRKHASYFDGSSSGRGKGIEYAGVRNKGFDLEEDEAQMPKSLVRLKYQETTDEPIRLQGKNGVLKVMVNKKKKMDFHSHPKKYDPREFEERGGSWSEDVMKKDMSGQLPVFPASKLPEKKQGLFLDKEKMIEKERMEVKLAKVKPVPSKGIKKARESEFDGLSTGKKVRDLVSNGTDTALKLAPPGAQASSSKKRVKKEEVKIIPAETVTPVKGKEGKAKRGGSTEKQMLREKIREMLLDAGWTIDYRPRRNRDYLDAVYINRSGTAYWSIIKAYEALKKQLEEDKNKSKADVGSPSFAPLAEDLINKLTRQTKKKIEEEMKRKRKEDGLTKSAKRSAAGDAGDSSDSDHNEERFSSYMKQNYKLKKSKSREVDQESDDELSDDSPKRKMRKVRAEKPSIAFRSTAIQARTSKVIGRCTLLVRGSDRGENSESDGYVPYRGKRTVLAWLIDSGTAQLSEKVQYMNRRKNRVMLEGWMTREGIHCGCCSKILSVSKFELHAGSKLRQPYQNIFLESGASLLQCQVDAWNKQGESICRDFHTVDVDGDGDDPDDDTCGLCGDGGALICCDSCPSTFHPVCLGIQMLPSGDWHCPNCTCKFCGDASGNVDGENDSTADELIRCSFCEKKYHKSCSEEVDTVPMSSNSAPFCGLKCQELYDHLQKILGVKHELEAGYAWSFIQRTDVSDTSNRGFPQRVEFNSKLAVALSVMEECFLPIIDRRSRINMIHNVVYNCGSNFNRLNYRGFYTAILERGDEIVSAASIRIHGTRLAEMPFIGTRAIYRRQGMCRRLLSAIETELCSLKVEQLIIPAISEHMNTWTRVFGFHQLEDVVKKEIKSMNMLVFPGTDMLQKDLVKQETSEDLKFSESIKNETETSGKVNSVDSSSPSPAVPSNDNSAASASDSACESDNILLAQNGTIIVKSEVENKQEVSSADMENGLLNPLVKDTDANSCKIEVSSPKSIHDSSNEKQKPSDLESAEFANGNGNIKACEDAEHQTSVNNGSLESPLGSDSGKINSSTDDDDVEENDTCDRETDKPDVESKIEVDRKVSSPSSSSEASD